MKKLTLVLLATSVPTAARAGGFLVGESGSQALERGGAFVAKADDPTALWYNPAGLVNAKNIDVYVGLNLINYDLTFQRKVTAPINGEPTLFPSAHNDATLQPIPFISVVEKIGPVALAQGIYAPSAFPNRDFPCLRQENCTVDAAGTPAPQRYDIVSQSVTIIYPTLGVAYAPIKQLSLGVSASWGIAKTSARNFPWTLTNHAEDPGFDADFEANATDNTVFKLSFGVQAKPTDYLEIGATFDLGGQFRGQGTGDATLGARLQELQATTGLPLPADIVPVADRDAQCAPGGTQSELKTCINYDLPASAQVGVRYVFRDGAGAERGDVEADFRWEGWGDGQDIEVVVDGKDNTLLETRLKPVYIRHGFRSTYSGRLGGAYRFAFGDKGLTARAGFGFDTAAAPDSWTRTDMDGRARQTFGLGAAFDMPGWRFDVGLAFVHEGQIDVTRTSTPTTPPPPDDRNQPDPPQPRVDQDSPYYEYHPINEGRYDSGYVIGTFGVTATF